MARRRIDITGWLDDTFAPGLYGPDGINENVEANLRDVLALQFGIQLERLEAGSILLAEGGWRMEQSGPCTFEVYDPDGRRVHNIIQAGLVTVDEITDWAWKWWHQRGGREISVNASRSRSGH